jgi:uncharacterized membrane protein YphA (DoxX/SURF4 family)
MKSQASSPAKSGTAASRPASDLLAWLGLAIRLGAAAVWIFAGLAKIPNLSAFEVSVLKYRLLPSPLVAPFAYALPFLELGIGLYLALGLFVRGTAVAGTVLFAVFFTAQTWALAQGISLDCGCFGSALETNVSPLTLLRDFGLGAPTFLMVAFPARLFSLDRRLFGALDLFGGLRKQHS